MTRPTDVVLLELLNEARKEIRAWRHHFDVIPDAGQIDTLPEELKAASAALKVANLDTFYAKVDRAHAAWLRTNGHPRDAIAAALLAAGIAEDVTTADELYPEHEKLKAVGPARAAVQEFIDWLYDDAQWCVADRMVVCEYCGNNEEGCPCKRFRGEDRLYRVGMTREALMAKHFGIDMQTLDDEKRAMLDAIRAQHQPRKKTT